jgi:hypothetical protein
MGCKYLYVAFITEIKERGRHTVFKKKELKYADERPSLLF